MPRQAKDNTIDTTGETVESSSGAGPQTVTKWEVFNKAGLVPTEIWCQGYLPIHRSDSSCHTRLRLLADSIETHSEHGGGFRFDLKRLENKVWPGWKGLQAKGLECHDFRCDVCDKVVPMHPLHIMNHMRPHLSKNRRTQVGGVFYLTIGPGTPTPTEDSAFVDVDEYENA